MRPYAVLALERALGFCNRAFTGSCRHLRFILGQPRNESRTLTMNECTPLPNDNKRPPLKIAPRGDYEY